jgi:thiamine-monophosphate kinase
VLIILLYSSGQRFHNGIIHSAVIHSVVTMNEFDLIKKYFRYRRCRDDVLLGPGDDAALLQPAADHELVVTMDTLIAGVHFPPDLPAHAIGFRSLAVNLSDLAAMGADPAWCLLSLSLPEANERWLDDFCAGFFSLADTVGLSLVGGDVVRGPLAITIQATGQVPRKQALLRSGAKPEEVIVIGGVPGEAAMGLEQWQAGKQAGHLVERFCYPQPQLALGRELRGRVSSCIDVSDGLLADLGHLLEESGGLGAKIELARLPTTDILRDSAERVRVLQAQLGGGDDYLLLFTQSVTNPLPKGCFVIGFTLPDGGIRVVDEADQTMQQDAIGWQHF